MLQPFPVFVDPSHVALGDGVYSMLLLGLFSY